MASLYDRFFIWSKQAGAKCDDANIQCVDTCMQYSMYCMVDLCTICELTRLEIYICSDSLAASAALLWSVKWQHKSISLIGINFSVTTKKVVMGITFFLLSGQTCQ